ncbi:DUF2399 domain-containing protein [Streptomyces sp. STCH 565 A]|uniref:DUF2399 domain-containing protein n=1 Tax=Streptomyces sp. STCH 565 A TaxID=2950532 RepID=UPI002074C788|nr:DUF2399 domain-containing protein [Streptomyces sp. STCH 565 A]MCM8555416.1 DUF2399 domain-containing protein [Streptomyces sp. STCH 565 A]
MTADHARLAADPELAPLWQAIHDRLSAGSAPADIATVTVPGLEPGAVAALKAWLDTPTQRRRGRTRVPHTERGAKVPLPPLMSALGLTTDTLQALVEDAVGRAVVNRRNGRLAAAALRQELVRYADEQLPQLPRLRIRLTSGAAEETAPEMRRLIDALASITRNLPHTPPRTLAKLAHDHAGDPHYFDPATSPGQRLITALAELAGRPEPTRPDHIRALLASHGIIADRLSATVLLHQVTALGDGPIDRRLNEATTPVALNLLDLTHTPPRLAPHPLTVVENPSVLEAAMERDSSQPIACTSGQLRAVDHALLQLAVDQGVPLRYAGDLDAAGLHIAATVQQTYGAELVAMDSTVVHAAGDVPSAIPLGPLPSNCDPALAKHLRAAGRVLYQEHDAVLTHLLDLDPALRKPPNPAPRQEGE